jgi:hypothetical protein
MFEFDVDARIVEAIDEAIARFIRDRGIHPCDQMTRAYHGDQEAAKLVSDFLEDYLAPMVNNEFVREEFLGMAQMARTGEWKMVVDWYCRMIEAQFN